MSAGVRIALVDDQALVRRGLASLLQGCGITVELEYADGQALVEDWTGEHAPVDVIVSDVRMPGLDGLTMTARLRASGDATPIILLTTFDDTDVLLEAARDGAQGFLLKDASPEDLADAITRAARGEQWLQPVATDPVRERFAFHDQRPPLETFNAREVAILRLMAGGYSNREIAASLFLAEGTVKNYVSEILAKLDTRDRTRAVLKAITLRVI